MRHKKPKGADPLSGGCTLHRATAGCVEDAEAKLTRVPAAQIFALSKNLCPSGVEPPTSAFGGQRSRNIYPPKAE